MKIKMKCFNSNNLTLLENLKMIDVKLLSGRTLGAEINGIILTDVSDENFKSINQNLLLEHKVIFLQRSTFNHRFCKFIALAQIWIILETHAYVKKLRWI